MQPRARRRYMLDLSDPRFDFIFEAAATEFPEGSTIREVLCEFIARGAGVEPLPAAIAMARREAYLVARLEATALLGAAGQRLARASWDSVGTFAVEIDALRREMVAASAPPAPPEPEREPVTLDEHLERLRRIGR
jgi:hypothetical protein